VAYKIRSDESMRHAVRRMARGQLHGAAESLSDADLPLAERVHDARTALKKVRALIVLAHPSRKRRARREDRRLRDVARALSELRDAEVLIKTFDELLEAHEAADVHSPALLQARVQLADRLRRILRPLEAERRLAAVAEDLDRARRRVRRWVPRPRGWRAVGPGLVTGYRRARRNMASAYDRESSTAFHDWRKAIKAHRHHLYVLQELWPQEIDVRLSELEHLGELLGEEHDLALLDKMVRSQRTCFGAERDYRRLLALIEKRRRMRRAEARPLGEQLFVERPRELRRRFRSYFDSFRRRGPARAAEPAPPAPPASNGNGAGHHRRRPPQFAGGGIGTRSSTRTGAMLPEGSATLA
jgi:CHAD domain-containing protein